MGKDRQGKLRGKCTEEGCPWAVHMTHGSCDEFEPAKSGVKCVFCRHTVKHCLLDSGAEYMSVCLPFIVVIHINTSTLCTCVVTEQCSLCSYT